MRKPGYDKRKYARQNERRRKKREARRKLKAGSSKTATVSATGNHGVFASFYLSTSDSSSDSDSDEESDSSDNGNESPVETKQEAKGGAFLDAVDREASLVGLSRALGRFGLTMHKDHFAACSAVELRAFSARYNKHNPVRLLSPL